MHAAAGGDDADEHQPSAGRRASSTRKDFVSDQDVRWCPGCGDYSILAQVQKVLPELGIPRENFVFVSGIGCSSRFPYYMNTYGFHSIHGRAPAIATGLKVTRPELSVWVVTGDGDALSIGGNHLIHVLRRNLDLNILLFNNRIYGLTKGQYSPTSRARQGDQVHARWARSTTRSTRSRSRSAPRRRSSPASIDVEVKHLQEIVRRAHAHRGTSFVEILQNCNVFNDGAFDYVTDKDTKADTTLVLEHGKPLIFGKNRDKGIRLNGFAARGRARSATASARDDLLVHDEHDPTPRLPARAHAARRSSRRRSACSARSSARCYDEAVQRADRRGQGARTPPTSARCCGAATPGSSAERTHDTSGSAPPSHRRRHAGWITTTSCARVHRARWRVASSSPPSGWPRRWLATGRMTVSADDLKIARDFLEQVGCNVRELPGVLVQLEDEARPCRGDVARGGPAPGPSAASSPTCATGRPGRN